MPIRPLTRLEKVLATVARQMQLCCSREVGNIPADMLRQSPDECR